MEIMAARNYSRDSGLKYRLLLWMMRGNEKLVSVEDEWLMENGLDVGSEWPSGV